MRRRWLLVLAAGLILSADVPRKEVVYQKLAKEPQGDYVKVQIKGKLDVVTVDADGRAKDGQAVGLIPPGDGRLRGWVATWETWVPPGVRLPPGRVPRGPVLPGTPEAAAAMGHPPGMYWVLVLDDENLRNVARNLKGKKVIVAAIAMPHVEPGFVPQAPGPLCLYLEVTSLRAAEDKK